MSPFSTRECGGATRVVFLSGLRAPFAASIFGKSRMRKTVATFETVRALGREFPDLQESTMYGSPALKLGKRLVACLAIHRSAEPGSLVVRTDFEQRSALLSEDPETYYVTDHYAKHPVVLVRLARLPHDQLRDLLAAARHCVLAQGERSRKKSRRFPARSS
jgi:hypothetical protein